MFVSAGQALDVSIGVAQSRLAGIVRDGSLTQSSQQAYLGGMDHLLRVGPLGDRPGTSRIVRVQLLDPVYRHGAMTVGMRWEAVGVAATLFPVLDADIRLTAGSQGRGTRLEITGCYRPPLGALGAGLDRMVMNRVAELTVRAVLTSLAASLAETAPAAEPAPPGWLEQPARPGHNGPQTVCG
jgi:hypothetical protein